MEKKYNQRGFGYYEFKDCFGADCSLQESSSATTPKVWLGTHIDRMHLDQKQAEELIKRLQVFVITGGL